MTQKELNDLWIEILKMDFSSKYESLKSGFRAYKYFHDHMVETEFESQIESMGGRSSHFIERLDDEGIGCEEDEAFSFCIPILKELGCTVLADPRFFLEEDLGDFDGTPAGPEGLDESAGIIVFLPEKKEI